MNNKLRRFTESGSRLYLIVLVLFAVAAVFMQHYYLALAEASVILLLMIYSLVSRRMKEKQLASYIESITYDTENAKNNTLVNFPLPIVVFRLVDSNVTWGNDMFFNMCNVNSGKMDMRVTDVVPDFSTRWLLEGNTEYPTPVSLNGHIYRVHGNLVHSENEDENSTFMGITYWIDITDHENLKKKFKDTRPVASIIVIDNLEDLYRNQPERVKNDTRDAVEDKLNAWVDKYGGIIRRYERDRYIAMFEHRAVDAMREEKFDINRQVHEVRNPVGLEASLSIGIGIDGENYQEALQYALVASELALSRGGDQAVVKNKLNFEFFGGRGGEVEKRTKVRSRVMANTLSELIRDSSEVFVMGHHYADLDALGAAVGVCCVARKIGVKCYIVIDQDDNAAGSLLEHLKQDPEYEYAFLTRQEAFLKANGHTLLVVVDTNRPEQVEDPDLLEACNRIAVIDHHRVAATRIQNADMGFVEPYASSACELLTEIIEEIAEPKDVFKCEADALLSGIVLDTKSFTLRTGERTFEAAAYLRRCGADTYNVKKMFQNNFEDTVKKYAVLESVNLYRDVVAVAVQEEVRSRVVLAQAADEMLNISGVEASITAAPDGKGNIQVSARSIGDMNMQLVMESLGGGGNKNAAAALLKETDSKIASEKIYKAIDEYLG